MRGNCIISLPLGSLRLSLRACNAVGMLHNRHYVRLRPSFQVAAHLTALSVSHFVHLLKRLRDRFAYPMSLKVMVSKARSRLAYG